MNFIVNKRNILFALGIIILFPLGICVNKFWRLSISDVPPSWDSLFNGMAIIAALLALFYQIITSKNSEIENTINTLFLEIDSVKFKANKTNGPDALRSYSYEHGKILKDEINVVDSLTSILIQFDSLLLYFKNSSNSSLKLRAFTLFYSKIMWSSEDLILTELFIYQELAKKYIRVSRIVYNELRRDNLVERNDDFVKKINLLEKSIDYYNSKNEIEKQILRSTMVHFKLLHKPGKWQNWNHPYDELINHYNSALKFYTKE